MKRKICSFIASLLALSLFVTACGGDSDDDDDGPKDVTYTITFHTNYPSSSAKQDATETQTSKSVSFALNAKPASFVCDGYKFLGWSEESDSPMADYDDGKNIDMEVKSLNLYAVWAKERVITVTFNANDGSASPATTTQKSGKIVDGESFMLDATTFTRSGYVFIGWAKESNATDPLWDDGVEFEVNTFSVQSDDTATLYAVWLSENDPSLVTITFKANYTGATDADVKQHVKKTGEENETIALMPNQFARQGYQFAGWAESASGEKVYNDGAEVTLTATKTLYAVWRDVSHYYITFHAGKNGTGTMADQSVEVAQGAAQTIATLNECAFTKTGYKFIGWSKTDSGKDVDYFECDKITLEGSPETTKTNFYALWAADGSYITITLKANYTGATEADATQYAAKSNLATKKATLRANPFTRPGYVFNGWSIFSYQANKYYDDCGQVGVASDITLYALWQKESITVSFDANGGTGTIDPITAAYNATSEKYEAALDLTKFQTWTKSGYMLAFFTEAKSAALATDVYPDNDGKIAFEGEDDRTLYAQWQKSFITVKFNKGANSDVTGTTASVKANYDEDEGAYTATLTSNTFARSGYTFFGWAETDASSTKKYADGAKIKIEIDDMSDLLEPDDITLYALWKKSSIIVKFDANGGAGTMTSATAQYDITTDKYTIAALPSNDFVYTDREFLGWSTSNASASASYTDEGAFSYSDTFGFGLDVTLYAVWKRDFITVTLNANGGYGSDVTVQAQYNETTKCYEATLPANTFKRENYSTDEDYEFCGWANSAKKANFDSLTDFDSISKYYYSYSDGDKYSAGASTANDETLYALWKPKFHRIKFDTRGGGTVSDVFVSLDKTTATLPSSYDSPTKRNCEFFGWTTAKQSSDGDMWTSATGGYAPGATYTISSSYPNNKYVETLYALWIPSYITLTYKNTSTFSTTTLPSENYVETYTTSITSGSDSGKMTSYVTIPIRATLTGKTAAFYGWKTGSSQTYNSKSAASSGGAQMPGEKFAFVKDTTLYATFLSSGSSDVIKVTYNGNGDGSMGGSSTGTLCYAVKNANFDLPENPVTHAEIANSYDFMCWTTDKNNKNYSSSSQPNFASIASSEDGWIDCDTVYGGFSSDTTLYAYWWKH